MTDQQEMAVQRQDTEWTDATAAPTEQDYRELQAQHDQLQSKYKAAIDVVRELVELPYSTSGVIERLEVRERARDLLAGYVPAPSVPQFPNWIPCSERMPEKGQHVIASVNFDSSIVKPLVCEMTWTGSTFRRGPNTVKPGLDCECVTHWMPRPDAPVLEAKP